MSHDISQYILRINWKKKGNKYFACALCGLDEEGNVIKKNPQMSRVIRHIRNHHNIETYKDKFRIE